MLAALVVGGSAAADSNGGLGDLPIEPQWLANTLTRALAFNEVKNNPTEGAIARRDAATADWKAAQAAFKNGTGAQPDPRAKPEYSVVWSSKQNAADVNSDVLSKLISNLQVNPEGLLDVLNPQFLPGLDGWQVIDQRKLNTNGSPNPDYGKVVNFVQLPLPWGVENEAHHMQYEWEDGDPIVAGSLFVGTTFVVDPTDVPNLKLTNTITALEHPSGTIADAYEKNKDGRFVLTLMGGPLFNFGGSPGSLLTLKPHPEKGLVPESEVPAGNIGGIFTGNAGGVPEPCSLRETFPIATGTCANPHGIQFRPDLGVGLTADFAEPRLIVLDPVKYLDKGIFRPTVRSWDITNSSKPKLQGVGHVPDGPFEPVHGLHKQIGIMEDAKTWPDAKAKYNGIDSKGFFAGSMCGGGIFFIPDATKAKGDFSNQIVQVWNDGLSTLNVTGDSASKFLDEPASCPGGAWHQVAPNNKILFRSVQGRAPASTTYFDQGASKIVYDIDISPLIESAQDGEVLCDLSRGIHKGGYDLTGIQLFHELAKGKTIADCPKLIDALKVNDVTSGGPHWGALDNHSLDQNGVPWRLTFSNYFVSRTGVDGDHRFYTVDVSPEGKLSYDEDFRDEKTGAIGVNFNRKNWPGSPQAGFYKPHSMLWVCPPGICPKDAAPAVRNAADKTAPQLTKVSLAPKKARRGKHRSTVLRATLSEQSKVTIRIERKSTGRKSGKKIRSSVKPLGKGKRKVKIAIRSLKAGTYTVVVSARDAAGNASKVKRLRLTVLKAKKKK